MLRKGTLHARDEAIRADGTCLAVTLVNRPPHGIMAWAGRLARPSCDKSAQDIDVADYLTVEKVSFCSWQDVWDYFADREYAPLVSELRVQVESLYPGE